MTAPAPASRPKPLDGLTVVDLTIALAGPYATFLLAGLGARVIKVENPAHGDPCRTNAPYVGRDGVTLTRTHDDDVSASALNRLRGKLGTTLNLKHPARRARSSPICVRHADVVVENFSAGTLDRLGVGYEFAREVNPRIVFCSLSGFGADKASPGGKAMDTIIQALSGLMMTSGEPSDGPVRVGVPVADMVAPLFGVIGILAALQQRERTGAGQHVDVSMLGALTSMVAGRAVRFARTLRHPATNGTDGAASRAVRRLSQSRRLGGDLRADRAVRARRLRGDGSAGSRRRSALRDPRCARRECR